MIDENGECDVRNYEKISMTVHDVNIPGHDKVFTVVEFSEISGVSVQTLNRWHRDGRFRSETIQINGRMYRYYTHEHFKILKSSELYANLNQVRNADIIGEHFGKLEVLGFSDAAVRKGYYGSYVCRCDCDNIVELARSELLSGKHKSCGCKFHDLTGKDFGFWHVDGIAPCAYTPGGSKIFRYYCTCRCGTKRAVIARALTSGASQSCGCKHSQVLSKMFLNDLTGRDFGDLHVEKRAPSRISPSGKSVKSMWLCSCKCGRMITASSESLLLGRIDSCGQCREDGYRGASMYESRVADYLESIGLFAEEGGYVQYKTYPDLLGVGGGYLLYDFYVPISDGYEWLIECQGEQHYKPVKWYGGDAYFEKLKEHDRRKKNYAEKIGAKFVEVPFDCVGYDAISKLLYDSGLKGQNP